MLEYVNPSNAQIKVFGVGGGGSNAVDCMINDGGISLENITFICSNTDAQALQRSKAPIKIQLGTNLTSGLGAGANPKIGETAAIEDQDRIREVLLGADMVFITAGMGGGTGTGAAPVIAQIAKSLEILTVAVVTKPLKIEGKHRMESAERGIQELRKHVDSLIEIPNQRLLGQAEGMGVMQTFAFANKVLIDAVKGITEIINCNGVVNVDFADVKTIMSNQGSPSALMGTGIGRGEKRALSAAAAAISSPLLTHDISGASAVLMNFTGGITMSLEEIHDAADTITQKIAGDPQVILGMVVDETGEFDDECMKVTVIATGFPESMREDYFDSTVATGSPYGRNHSRPAVPARSQMNSHPPFDGQTYKTPSVSTNPPIVNDASSSSSDEHPQWQAEAPSLLQESEFAQASSRSRQQSIPPHSNLSTSSTSNISYGLDDLGNPHTQTKRSHHDPVHDSSNAHYQNSRHNSGHANTSAYSGQQANHSGVRYPDRSTGYAPARSSYASSGNYSQGSGYRGRSSRGYEQGYANNSSASYGQNYSSSRQEDPYQNNKAATHQQQSQHAYANPSSFTGGEQKRHVQSSNENLPIERSYSSSDSQPRQAQNSVGSRSGSNKVVGRATGRGPRERARSLSSIEPVASIGKSEDDWGARGQQKPSQSTHNNESGYNRNGSNVNNTQDYESVSLNPNGLRTYQG